MVTDRELAQVCYDLYFNTQNIDAILDIDNVVVGIKHLPESSIICFRGSTTILDWVRDFQSQMIPDAELGGVECGFLQGIRDIIGKRPGNAIPDKPVYITGHSLGAARALIFAALETLKKLPIAGVAVFGPPRPGAAKIKEILAGVPIRLYRNCNDPVCAVPFDIPLFDPYVHVGELIQLQCPPDPSDPWGPFAAHHIQYYMKGLDNAAIASGTPA